jgi:hypothetical protein
MLWLYWILLVIGFAGGLMAYFFYLTPNPRDEE